MGTQRGYKPYAATFRRLKARWYGPKNWSSLLQRSTPNFGVTEEGRQCNTTPKEQAQGEKKEVETNHDFKQGDRVAEKSQGSDYYRHRKEQ